MSILQRLDDERIFNVSKEGVLIAFTERCDDHFTVELTPDEVRQLAQELLNIADSTP